MVWHFQETVRIPMLLPNIEASPVRIPSAVVNCHAISHGLEQYVAQKRATELSKFLALCATSHQPLAPSLAVDAIWHDFILHTRDYLTYCESTFGHFIHHSPSCGTPTDMRQIYMDTLTALVNAFGDIDSTIWPIDGEAPLAICDSGRDKLALQVDSEGR